MLSLKGSVDTQDCTLAAYLYQNYLFSRYPDLPNELMIKKINHLSSENSFHPVSITSHSISMTTDR